MTKKAKPKELTPEEKAIQAAKAEAFLQGKEVGYKAGHSDGKEGGMKEGVQLGKKEGMELGRKEGYNHGYKAGNEAGFEVGKKEGKREGAHAIYPVAFSEGKLEAIRKLVTSLETKMADAAGYQDRAKWAREGQVPAFWIAVLIENWEPSLGKQPRESEAELVDVEQ